MRFLLLALLLLCGCTPASADFIPKSHDIELDNPTYQQVTEILKELKGIQIDGNCLDRTQYVQDYCYGRGIQCYVLVSNFKDLRGHATVAFNTDKGWICVEPDGMLEIKIAEGLPYYIPMRAYSLPVGMTAKEFAEENTVTQLTIFK